MSLRDLTTVKIFFRNIEINLLYWRAGRTIILKKLKNGNLHTGAFKIVS